MTTHPLVKDFQGLPAYGIPGLIRKLTTFAIKIENKRIIQAALKDGAGSEAFKAFARVLTELFPGFGNGDEQAAKILGDPCACYYLEQIASGSHLDQIPGFQTYDI
jgi:hypothetical protein